MRSAVGTLVLLTAVAGCAGSRPRPSATTAPSPLGQPADRQSAATAVVCRNAAFGLLVTRPAGWATDIARPYSPACIYLGRVDAYVRPATEDAPDVAVNITRDAQVQRFTTTDPCSKLVADQPSRVAGRPGRREETVTRTGPCERPAGWHFLTWTAQLGGGWVVQVTGIERPGQVGQVRTGAALVAERLQVFEPATGWRDTRTQSPPPTPTTANRPPAG